MPATALDVLTPTHKTAVTLPASPGRAANTVDGDLAPNNGSSILLINNTGGSAYSTQIFFKDKVDQQDVTPITVSTPANTIHLLNLGSPALYGTQVLVKGANAALKYAVIQ